MNLNAIKDSANLYLFKKELAGEKFFAYADYANSVSIAITSENVKAKKKGNDAISFDYGKTGTFSLSFEVFTKSILALLVGQDAVKGNHEYIKREVLTASASNTATMVGTAKAGTLSVGVTEDGYTFTQELESGAAANAGEYSIAGKVITCNATDAPEGTKIMVVYIEEGSNLEKLTINGNVFPKGFRCYFDTTMKDDNQIERMIQVELPNIKPQANITITFDSQAVATIEITADILVDENDEMVNILFLD